jgi:predicted branched-subunit amino acid permease
MNTHPTSQFFAGARAELPILLGVAPFGMIYGILALGAGLSPLAAQAMSSIVFAGSAQFMLVQLVGMGTPALVMILTGFVINLRHALYSASVSPHTLGLNPVWKGLLSYLLTDEAYAVAILHYNADSPRRTNTGIFRCRADALDRLANQHCDWHLPWGANSRRLGA